MPKSLTGSVISQIDAAYKRPVLLFELGLSSTLRFAAYKSNVVFPTGVSTYTAKNILIGNVGQSLEGQIERILINFDNVAKDMAAYAHNEDFRGKTIVIKRVYLDALTNATDYVEVFNGYMERPSEFGRYFLNVPATIGKSLTRKSLIFPYQKMCPWKPGGTECNTNGLFDLTALKAAGTADSGSTTTLVDNALTQVDYYWNYGEIEITKSGKTYYRKVKDFNAASDTITLDVELPVAVDATYTYVVYKGCSLTWESCSFTLAWGPSADNSANFGGCIHIAKKADAEAKFLPDMPPRFTLP